MPPWACSKRPARRREAPVKAPFSWPKSSLSSSVLGIGRAVDHHEGLLPAGAVLVDGPGDQLLAGAALPLDEHGGIGRRHVLDQLVDDLHLGVLADQPAELGRGLDAGPQFPDLLLVQHRPAQRTGGLL